MLKNAKIGVKLGVGFGFLIVVIAIIAIIAISSQLRVSERVSYLLEVNLEKQNHGNEVVTQLFTNASAYKSIALGENIQEQRAIIRETSAEVASRIDIVERLLNPNNREEAALWTNALNARAAYRNVLGVMDAYIEADDLDSVIAFITGEFTDRQQDYLRSFESFADFQANFMQTSGQAIESQIAQSIMTLVIVIVISLLIAIIFAVIITRMITKPISECVDVAQNLGHGHTNVKIVVDSKDETGILKEAMRTMASAIQGVYEDCIFLSGEAAAGKMSTRLDIRKHDNDFSKLVAGINGILDAIAAPLKETMEVVDKLANKDLTVRVTTKYPGDFDTLMQNMNQAAKTLEESLVQVDMAVEQITAASNEISSGSQVLAEATSEQASSLEEISSSLEEINSLTGNNADNAKSGLKLADQAVMSVDASNEAMEKMNKAMEAILKSSQETGKILKNIDEIAFQTNLLALNAAVEAAHAGDAGKGFAVVAEEVKNLALRSAEAAKTTNDLIDDSTRNSEMGARIVEQVTKSFIEMKEQFNKVKSIVNEISASSDEQAHGVNQISTGVNEMNRVTQQNAANAEESASAAEQLTSQAAELKSMVATFSINKRASGGTFRAAPTKNLHVTSDRRQAPAQISHAKPKNAYEVKPEAMLPLDSFDDDFDDFK
ncbi:MAG: methyl-accepting chemotaxis protein [Candidatus Cloacimonetes bacterium]|nr:methyl-accepting chemotaxis protein [Candidatus Cloacimonadota bacterium]